MIINNNIPALNTFRQMGINQNNMQKSMEKLSSGLRINRAGDDAAGLAISEKMRAQIRGLDQASRNAQDGISLIQTAEGALDESHSILQRMRELATQAANDTNVVVDRAELQKEIDQLSQELTRIADTTEFNTQNLLGGDFEGKFHIGANAGQDITLSIDEMDADALGVQGTVYDAQALTGVTGLSIESLTGDDITIEFVTAGDKDAGAIKNAAEYDAESSKITITLAQDAGDGDDAGEVTATNAEIKSMLESIAGDAGIRVVADEDYNDTVADSIADVGDFTLNEWELNKEASKAAGINISSQAAASEAITTINDAIETVSAQRSNLGAVQNRLEHTISNLDNSAENLQAAESRIRDVDMAKEMMEMTRTNILSQASQAMLAQANQLPQSVLQLLG